MNSQSQGSQPSSPAHCLECGQPLVTQDSIAACPALRLRIGRFHARVAWLGIEAPARQWAVEYLSEAHPYPVPIAALFVDGFLRRYAGLSLGFTTSLAFSLAVFIALAWKRRWPLIPADGSTQWLIAPLLRGLRRSGWTWAREVETVVDADSSSVHSATPGSLQGADTGRQPPTLGGRGAHRPRSCLRR